eukprot:13471822-Ditylum_brightwellii.AAC.1
MPRSRNDSLPAFHKIRKVQPDIQGLCIPSLISYATNFGRETVYFFNAVLESKTDKSYQNKLLSPEACMEVGQYEYSLTSHEIKPKSMELHKGNEKEGIEGFDGIVTTFKSISISVDPISLTDIGSQ